MGACGLENHVEHVGQCGGLSTLDNVGESPLGVMWGYSHREVRAVPTLNARKLQDVAAVIRAAREDAGLRQEELAERLAFSRDYMIELESGKGNLYTTTTLPNTP